MKRKLISSRRKSNWNYYGVRIIKQIVVEGEADPHLIDEDFDENANQLFEESVMLVRARSFDHAYEVAERKTTEFEGPYKNLYGEQVTWKFIEAIDCYLVDPVLKSGTEVYSCFHSTEPNVTGTEFINKWFRHVDDDGNFPYFENTGTIDL